jgi:hypothetical protein
MMGTLGSATMILEISFSTSDEPPHQTPQNSSLRPHGTSSVRVISQIKMILNFLQLSGTCFENKSTISYLDLRPLINKLNLHLSDPESRSKDPTRFSL